MNTLIRLIKEPFVHFIALGALIFLAYAMFNTTTEPQSKVTIEVTPPRVDQLKSGFKNTWRRDPTEKELDGLIEGYIRNEVLYRAALELGLDRNDPVIRNRLRYKIEFLSDSGALLANPEEEDLEDYLQEFGKKYQIEPRSSFLQIYLGERPSPGEVEPILEKARALGAAPQFVDLGKRTLLPPQVRSASPQQIAAKFGERFVSEVSSLEPNTWTGPVSSGYGAHLIYITEKMPGRVPELAEVKELVLRDWQQAKSVELRNEQYMQLRKQFEIVIDPEVGK